MFAIRKAAGIDGDEQKLRRNFTHSPSKIFAFYVSEEKVFVRCLEMKYFSLKSFYCSFM